MKDDSSKKQRKHEEKTKVIKELQEIIAKVLQK